ncbi:MAG: exo-alpha-sialidase [Chlorobi bacterium]|nr:exo-alpha-sialidase [Chlorobiota bacterium]
MKKIFTSLFMMLSIAAIAQTSPSIITEVDYYNATRYTGARNIARTTDGYLMVVFEPGTGYPDNTEIHYAYYNQAFTSWDLGQLSSSTTQATGVPAIIADESGRLYAAWKEEAADGKRNAMSSKCNFTDEFTYTWSPPVVSDNIDNNTGVLTIDLSDDNDIFILFSIWNDPAIFDANIYASRSTDDGSTWNTANLTSVFPTPNELPLNYIDVSLTDGSDGKMYAAWEDYPSELTNQYETLFSEYSTLPRQVGANRRLFPRYTTEIQSLTNTPTVVRLSATPCQYMKWARAAISSKVRVRFLNISV